MPAPFVTGAFNFDQLFDDSFLLKHDYVFNTLKSTPYECLLFFFNNVYLKAGKDLGDKVVHTPILQMWKLNPRKSTYHITS